MTSTASTATTFLRADLVQAMERATKGRTSILILAGLISAAERAPQVVRRVSEISSASFSAAATGALGWNRNTKRAATWNTRSRSISGTRCGGTGKLRTACKTCGGEGRVRRTETIDVRIPAGVANGGRVRVPGKGNAGTMGAPPGDLYLRVVVRPHEFFERRGNDLYTKVPVTVAEASLGAKVEVPTIDGRSLVRIPPATNSGKTLRLKEKGVPSARTGARGDQYVEIQVIVPKPTDERVRNLMKELETVAPDDPRKDLFAKAGV